jgi:tellurite resistance protein
MLSELTSEERLLLLEFVCAFAWADLEIRDEERDFVHRLVRQLELPPEEAEKVDEWLRVPPKPEDVDPNKVPRRHRELFLAAAHLMISSDGEIAPEEREDYELLQQLLS